MFITINKTTVVATVTNTNNVAVTKIIGLLRAPTACNNSPGQSGGVDLVLGSSSGTG